MKHQYHFVDSLNITFQINNINLHLIKLVTSSVTDVIMTNDMLAFVLKIQVSQLQKKTFVYYLNEQTKLINTNSIKKSRKKLNILYYPQKIQDQNILLNY